MKDSKEYSQKVRSLYRSLKRRYKKPPKVVYDEPVEAIVHAAISENITESETQSANKRIAGSFVDLNDLRVSRTEEIVESLGKDTPATREMASALTGILSAIFNKYNTVSLKVLKKTGKRQARQVLEKIDDITCFMVDYCMLTALQGHAIPLTKKMIEYLKNNDLAHPAADEQQIEGFLARQIPAESGYEFYALLRQCSESAKAGPRTSAGKGTGRKKRTKTASKSRKKTKKKG